MKFFLACGLTFLSPMVYGNLGVDYFPLAVGNSWTYRSQPGMPHGRVTTFSGQKFVALSKADTLDVTLAHGAT
jgi:hypothetical protein